MRLVKGTVSSANIDVLLPQARRWLPLPDLASLLGWRR
jgi:hypothetical protein